MQESRNTSLSPLKRSATTPNLHLPSQKLLAEDDDDEETLQLQLAAIEAKLKLKRLQQTKARDLTPSIDTASVPGRSASVLSKASSARPLSRDQGDQGDPYGKVEVPLSPTKRSAPAAEPRSPSRVLLGIDKGWTGKDVSLGRTSSGRVGGSRLTVRSTKYDSERTPSGQGSSTSAIPRVKSFSERLAEGRAQETAREVRNEELSRKRSTGFKVNAEEVESFHRAAEEAKAHAASRSPIRKDAADYGREAVLAAYHGNRSGALKRSNTTNTLSSIGSGHDQPTKKGSKDPSVYDPYSQLHLSNRILPHSFIQRTLDNAEPVRIPWLLRNIISPNYELPSSVTSDFVLFGVIGSKSSPMNQQNRNDGKIQSATDWEKKWDDGSHNERKFMVLTLTDLVWTIDLYLFSTAVPRYHRLSPGTLIAILNPGIMPPKRGKQDTGQFSLALNSGTETILEIGTARDLGFCKAVKKDGNQCMSWIDSRKTEFCDWHLDTQIRKTQASRMGVNSSESSILSSNRFGRGGSSYKPQRSESQGGQDGERGAKGKGLLPRDGARYNFESDSMFYAVKSNAPALNKGPSHNRPHSAMNDDPFLAEGTFTRDGISKTERLRKRLAREAKEREIAKRLGESDVGRGRIAAGGEYLRKRSGQHSTTTSSGTSTPSRLDGSSGLSCSATKPSNASEALSHILSSSSKDETPSLNVNGKRSADDVRLSPVKRKATLVDTASQGRSIKSRKVTRFITEKGIREAGRESLPGPAGTDHDINADDDDDLDIV